MEQPYRLYLGRSPCVCIPSRNSSVPVSLFHMFHSGVGYATADSNGYGKSTSQIAALIYTYIALDSRQRRRSWCGLCKIVNHLYRSSSFIHPQVGFLSNLVKVFPSLATRPLYLTGESYAGRYIVRMPSKHIERQYSHTFAALHCSSTILVIITSSEARQNRCRQSCIWFIP